MAGEHSAWTEKLINRFWSYVAKADGCWLWQSGTFDNGYGRFRHGLRQRRAHRCSYELTHGPIPEDQVVRHKCDTPLCCNPDHLELGTPADNVRDRDERGRTSRDHYPVLPGALNPSAKLTAEQVAVLRRKRSEGATLKALATEFQISKSQAGNIARGESWPL